MSAEGRRSRDEAPTGDASYRLPLVAVRSTLAHGGTRLAAALTYYATLSLAPAMIVLVSLIGLIGGGSEQNGEAILEAVGEVAPPAVVDALEGPVEAIARGDYAGEFFWVGLILSLWAASGYVGTFIWAADVMCEVERREPALRRIPRQLAIAVVSLVSLAILAAIVTGSGPVARWVGDLLDLGDTTLTLWSYGRWLLFVVVATVEFGLLYRLGPAGQAFRLRWVSTGGLVAVLLALAASLGFSVYVANFGSYDRTYGALATFIVFLVWLWLVDLMLVFGFELNLALSSRRSGKVDGGAGDEAPPRVT
jgi:membrane protein